MKSPTKDDMDFSDDEVSENGKKSETLFNNDNITQNDEVVQPEAFDEPVKLVSTGNYTSPSPADAHNDLDEPVGPPTAAM